jgi:hypothetical protein
MINWIAQEEMYEWFRVHAGGEICCIYQGHRVRMADHLGGHTYHLGLPRLLPLDSIQDVLQWYEVNVCNKDLRDPRGFRVRFKVEHFVHLIKLTTKYGEEPKNRTSAIVEIKSGKIKFVAGRFNPQRASEIPWAVELVTNPFCICRNWQALGSGDENYIKNFGTEHYPQWRVLVVKVVGQTRHCSTIFPREIQAKHLEPRIWP